MIVLLSLQVIAQLHGFTKYEADQCHTGMTMREICLILDTPASGCMEDNTGKMCFWISGVHTLAVSFDPKTDRAKSVTYL
jgi:hypothetical protein